MAHLPQAQRDVIIWIEQRYQQNRLWWSRDQRRGNLYRMRNYYATLGIDRHQARQWEAAATTAEDGWRTHHIPQVQARAVMRLIFDEYY
ncbi:hypothetical protein AAVH_19579 [Aphelenchoides avenae]|nr:hypothetical protein AAVH_19579 [Aphelenchus avenae]